MRKFLVVDDSRAIRLMLSGAIRKVRADADILEAEDHEGALALFRKDPPDVVFLDMMLVGRKGGLDLLGELLAERPEARIVISTSLPRHHRDVVDAMSLGASAYIEKPVRVENIRDVLADLAEDEGEDGRIR